MTTPQNELYNLSYKINSLIKLFEVGDDEKCIFQTIKEIKVDNDILIKKIENIENMMSFDEVESWKSDNFIQLKDLELCELCNDNVKLKILKLYNQQNNEKLI